MAPGLTFTKAHTSILNDFKACFEKHPAALAIIMIPGTILSEAVKLTALAVDLLKDSVLTAFSLAATILTLGLNDWAKKKLAYNAEGLAQDLVIIFYSVLVDPFQIIYSEYENLSIIGNSIRQSCFGK